MSRQETIGFNPPSQPNPCVRTWGPGPDGKACKTCAHLVTRTYYPKVYYKCEYRRDTACAATDHRVRWQACAKYVECDE